MSEEFVAVIVTVSTCCIMPIVIVWLVTKARTQRTDRKMEVLLKAIEKGTEINPELLVESNGGRDVKMKLLKQLGTGVVTSILGLVCILFAAFNVLSFDEWGYYAGLPFLAIGVGMLVSFAFGIKFLKPEIEADERKLRK